MEQIAYHDQSRRLIALTGVDGEEFLQGLISNDVKALDTGLIYTALLSPQGKYLFDFFVARHGDGLLLDVAADQAAALATRLSMYKLRAKVDLAESPLIVLRGAGDVPDDGYADPRDPRMGWRAYRAAGDYPALPDGAFDAARVAAMVPEAGAELVSNDSYILEMGFERLNGVSFRKGCYVGQEVTARMKHKTELRKGLVRVRLSAEVPRGTDIEIGGRVIGQVFTQAGGEGLAYIRHDMAGPGMTAGGVQVELA